MIVYKYNSYQNYCSNNPCNPWCTCYFYLYMVQLEVGGGSGVVPCLPVDVVPMATGGCSAWWALLVPPFWSREPQALFPAESPSSCGNIWAATSPSSHLLTFPGLAAMVDCICCSCLYGKLLGTGGEGGRGWVSAAVSPGRCHKHWSVTQVQMACVVSTSSTSTSPPEPTNRRLQISIERLPPSNPFIAGVLSVRCVCMHFANDFSMVWALKG